MHAFSKTCLATALLGAIAPPAVAQAAGTGNELEEIVVTAQKRVQRNVDVGLQVSAIGGEDLHGLRVEQVRDIASYIPNVDIKEQVPGAIPVVTIRGVGLDDFSSTNSPAAGIYVDEVPLSSLALMSFDLYDLERVEVVKGPQGTLYGRNSTAGAVNILTAAPRLGETDAMVRAGYGDYETGEVEGMFNLPLGDSFALRVSTKGTWQDEGYWESRREQDGSAGNRRIGERDQTNFRVQALWKPADAVSGTLKYEHIEQDSEMGQPEFFGQACAPGSAPIDPAHCTDLLGYSDTDGDPFEGDWVGDFPYEIDQDAVTLRLTADLGFATLSSVSGYIDMNRGFHIDSDASPNDEFNFVQQDEVEQWSQELRLSGNSELLDWQVGAFYSQDDVLVDTAGDHDSVLPFMHSQILADQTTEAAALFSSLDWHLAPSLVLVTGLRFTDERRDYTGGSTWTYNIPGLISNTFVDTDIDDTNWSWRVGLNWSPTEDMLVYGSAAKSWKSGGFFSGITLAQEQLQPYEPESLLAYEIGFKTQGVVTFSGSAFYYDYEGVQTFMRGGVAQLIGNVDDAELYGVDLDLAWMPVHGLTVQAGVGLLETELSSFIGPTGVPIEQGNEMPNAPGSTVNALARYEFPLGMAGLQLALQADARYTDDTFKDATNDPLIAADSYTLYNARVALAPEDLKWELAAWGRNLGDEEYVVNGLNAGGFFLGNRNYNAPRTYGLEFTYNF